MREFERKLYIISSTCLIKWNIFELTAQKKNTYFIFASDWSEEAVSSAEILRMIYQGRFLHGNVTLAGIVSDVIKYFLSQRIHFGMRFISFVLFFHCLTALGLPTGKTTVMHLVPRESLPEPNSQGNEILYFDYNRIFSFFVDVIKAYISKYYSLLSSLIFLYWNRWRKQEERTKSRVLFMFLAMNIDSCQENPSSLH